MRKNQQRPSNVIDYRRPPQGSELREKRVCASCIRETWMSGRIQESGELGTCDYCQKAGFRALALGEVAESTLEALRRHYEFQSAASAYSASPLRQDDTGNRREKDGALVTNLISSLLKPIDQRISTDIRQILSERVDAPAFDDPQHEPLFGLSSHWIYQSEVSDALILRWKGLESALRTKSRLFNQGFENFFHEVLDAASRQAQAGGMDIIKSAGPGSDMDTVHRSRVFESERDLEAALESPDVSLGAPPPELAKAGRMNSAGISVFYGATSPETTLSEIRPPVGSTALTAAFKIIRPLRILDADALAALQVSGSLFDSNYDYKTNRAYIDLLKVLKPRISRPVTPRDEEIDYLFTQAFAEYLSTLHNPPLDGILFESAQGNHEGRNLVLFSQACKVESLECPPGQTDFVITKVWKSGKGNFPSYSVRATVKGNRGSEEPQEANALDKGPAGEALPATSLRLDTKTMEIHHITGMSVASEKRPVDWQRN